MKNLILNDHVLAKQFVEELSELKEVLLPKIDEKMETIRRDADTLKIEASREMSCYEICRYKIQNHDSVVWAYIDALAWFWFKNTTPNDKDFHIIFLAALTNLK